MKKFLTLTLALVLVGTTIVSFSDASRDAYHTYLYQQALQQRSTRRFSVTGRTVVQKKTTALQKYTGRPNVQNLRYPRNKRNIFAGASATESKNLKMRPMSKTIGFPTERTSREKIAVKNLDATFLVTDTVVADRFSVELPKGWNPTIEKGILHVGDGKSFEITIQNLQEVCENVSFDSCAINLSNDMNHLENVGAKINSLSRVTRLTQRTDRILGTNTYTSTHTESFLGTYLGREVFITRYFVQEPGTTNVFLLETIADRQFASEAIVVAKRLSSSFRIIME